MSEVEGVYVFFAILVGIGLLHFVATVAAGLWEKRPVQPYYVPTSDEEYDPTDKADDANVAADKLGLQYGGVCHDGKGKLYRVRYDFWVAPDDSILAIIGGGTVASFSVDAIELFSRLTDGRTLLTTNHTGTADVSGVLQQVTCPNLAMQALYSRHQRRMAGEEVEPFPPDRPIAGYFEIRRRIAASLVRKGYASFMDADEKVWRYTLKGAFAFYFLAVWIRPIKHAFRKRG